MSLEKVIKIDQIEIVGDYKAIQVRTATVITDRYRRWGRVVTLISSARG